MAIFIFSFSWLKNYDLNNLKSTPLDIQGRRHSFLIQTYLVDYIYILGLSPLIRAVKNRNLGMVQLLIEKKAKITTTDQVKFYR